MLASFPWHFTFVGPDGVPCCPTLDCDFHFGLWIRLTHSLLCYLKLYTSSRLPAIDHQYDFPEVFSGFFHFMSLPRDRWDHEFTLSASSGSFKISFQWLSPTGDLKNYFENIDYNVSFYQWKMQRVTYEDGVRTWMVWKRRRWWAQVK
jgi:hypothetical protein